MKNLKGTTLSLFCGMALLGLTTESQATSLNFVPSSTAVSVGDTMSVDIVISDLYSQDLAGFDMNVLYDNSLFSFESYTLSDNLGDIALGNADDWSLGDQGDGSINLTELSWLWDLEWQSDSFTLATLYFDVTNTGDSLFSFDSVLLSDSFGGEIFASLGTSGVSISAGSEPVPEPATIFLFGSVIGGLGIIRSRRKNKAVA